jgi:hypothetical protein
MNCEVLRMKRVISLIAVLIFASAALAQAQIDGKKNPEKIPDSLAYFMYFNHVGYALDNESKNSTMVQLLLEGSGLNEVDQSVLKEVIIKHQIEQRTLMDKINTDVTIGTATEDSFTAYRSARTKCTMDAVNSVLTRISPEGAVGFKKFIQAFKANLSMDEGATKGWQ